MTPTTEPTIDDRLKGIMKLIADYASGWDVGCPEPSEEDIEQAIKALISDQVAKARIAELERLSDTYYDDGRIGWGDSTKESVEEWGENHADLWIPTRYVHKHIEDRIATLNGVKNKEKDNEN